MSTRVFSVCFALVAGVACGSTGDDASSRSGDPARVSSEERHRIDAGSIVDAGTFDGRPIDSALAADGRATDSGHAVDAAPPPTGSSGDILCYTEGNPSASCVLGAQHCCFNNYSSQHDGYCTTDPCTWGTLACDGPEDCAAGNVCCANPLVDPSDGTPTGYDVKCQAGPCKSGAPELCHAGGSGPCSSASASCVTTYLNYNDLPRVLSICR